MKFISNSDYGKPVETGTIFFTTANGIKITIHKIIHLDGWFLSCAQFQIDDQKLKAESLPEAIEESKEILKEYVKKCKRLHKTLYFRTLGNIKVLRRWDYDKNNFDYCRRYRRRPDRPEK